MNLQGHDSMIKGVRHIGLVVNDAQKALLFYQDFLGFTVYWDRVEEGTFIETLSGVSPLKVRTVKMKSGNGCVLELLCYDTQSCFSVKKLFHSGFSHFALTVEDLDGMFVFLKEKGVEFVSPPQVSPDKKAKVSFCRDFEGNHLELVQDLD